jgi:hypothetical protein
MGSVSDIQIVTVEWDVTRLAERVKNSRVKKDGSESVVDQNLEKHFQQSNFGHLHHPATILDCHGHIMLWHLPGVFIKTRTVRISLSFLAVTDIIIHRMTITLLL